MITDRGELERIGIRYCNTMATMAGTSAGTLRANYEYCMQNTGKFQDAIMGAGIDSYHAMVLYILHNILDVNQYCTEAFRDAVWEGGAFSQTTGSYNIYGRPYSGPA